MKVYSKDEENFPHEGIGELLDDIESDGELVAGREFESAFRKLQEENAALQSRIAQLVASAATLPPAVPEGMRLVPVSMSEVMQESVANILQRCIGQNNGTPSECSYEWADEMHKAMIDAVKGETA